MLVIWGRKNSLNVQKVLWCCEEIGLKYERKEAGGAFGVVNTPEYRDINPNGLVPTIDDDGVVLWESNAVVRYLSAKYSAGRLSSSDLATRADADRWMDWQQTTFWPAMRALFMGLIRTAPEKRDPKAIDESRVKTAEVLLVLDRYLASRAFVAGDALTMGDIPLGCSIWRWMALPIERPARPNVQRWFDALAQRSAFKSAVMQPLT
jgi:glutathione S-transferase